MLQLLESSKGCVVSSKGTCTRGTMNLENHRTLVTSNDTKSENFDEEFAELLQKTRQMWLNES